VGFFQGQKICALKNKAFLCSLLSHYNYHGVNIFTNGRISDTDAQSAEADLVSSSIGECEEIIIK